MKKRLNRFVVATRRRIGRETSDSHKATAARVQAEEGWQEGHRANDVPSWVRLQRGPPFPPPALPGGTTSPSAIPVGPASFSRALPVSIPAGLIETDSLIRFHQPRPSSKPRVDSCIRLFEACSAFHSPYGLPSCLVAFSDLLHHRLQQSRCLHRCADAVFSI